MPLAPPCDDHAKTFLLTPVERFDQIIVRDSYTNTCDTYPEDVEEKVEKTKKEFCDKRILKDFSEDAIEKKAIFLLENDAVSPIALRKNHNNELDETFEYR